MVCPTFLLARIEQTRHHFHRNPIFFYVDNEGCASQFADSEKQARAIRRFLADENKPPPSVPLVVNRAEGLVDFEYLFTTKDAEWGSKVGKMPANPTKELVHGQLTELTPEMFDHKSTFLVRFFCRIYLIHITLVLQTKNYFIKYAEKFQNLPYY